VGALLEVGVSEPVAGIVLAAGASTRMGRNKLLLPIGGEPLLRRSVRRALEAGLDPVAVVVGHEADRARETLSGLPCRILVNPDHAVGQQTSVRAGIRAVPAEANAAVILLADMPFVTAAMVSELVRLHRETGARLVLSDYGGVQAPPTLYARGIFSELDAAGGEGCSKRVIARHAGEAVRAAWPAAALADLDRPEDYERVRAQLAPGGEPECAPTS
jgi:molybdenum cofactor cytidylyltransferase